MGKNLQRQCFQMENMTDVSSNSSSERIISRCTFIFEYAAEVKDFVSLIGNTFQTNSGGTLRLDFSKQHLDVLCRNDSSFDYERKARYCRLFSEPVYMNESERQVKVTISELHENFYRPFQNLSVSSSIDVNTRLLYILAATVKSYLMGANDMAWIHLKQSKLVTSLTTLLHLKLTVDSIMIAHLHLQNEDTMFTQC